MISIIWDEKLITLFGKYQQALFPQFELAMDISSREIALNSMNDLENNKGGNSSTEWDLYFRLGQQDKYAPLKTIQRQPVKLE